AASDCEFRFRETLLAVAGAPGSARRTDVSWQGDANRYVGEGVWLWVEDRPTPGRGLEAWRGLWRDPRGGAAAGRGGGRGAGEWRVGGRGRARGRWGGGCGCGSRTVRRRCAAWRRGGPSGATPNGRRAKRAAGRSAADSDSWRLPAYLTVECRFPPRRARWP